jgi:hypothetical protein
MRNAIYENTPISRDVVETLLKQAVTLRLSIEKNIENSETAHKVQVA